MHLQSSRIHAFAVVEDAYSRSLFVEIRWQENCDIGCSGIERVSYQLLDSLIWASIRGLRKV